MYAQSISASLSGIVLDSNQAAVESADVEVTNRDTGALRRLTTSGRGLFRIPSLPAGDYRVAISAPGFARLVYESLPLVVGQSRTLTATLEPEALRQEITVSAEGAGQLETGAGNVGQTFEPAEMNDLPNVSGGQGRNFHTQVLLTPAIAPTYQQHRPFAVGGARSRNNSYQIDSNDYNEIEGGLLMGRGTSEQLVSVEALAGMQVQTHNFKAEYGRNNGAIVSMVTKQGTNEWHGSAYEFLRNEALSARNTFDLARPPLKTHQFGGTIGGPIRRDKTFVFGNYEALVRRAAAVNTIQTLTPQQKLAAAPAVRPLAALYPDPNLPGTNLFRSSVPQNGSLGTFLIRGDHTISDRQRVFARSLYLNTYTETRAGASLLQAHRDIGTQSHSVHHSWTPSARSLNEARFQFTRFKIDDTFDDPVQLGDPAVNGEVGAVAVGGLSSLGHFFFMAQKNFQNSFQASNDFSIILGRHALKMGGVGRRQQLNGGRFNPTLTGQLRFINAAEFLAGRPVSYSRNVGNPAVGLRSIEAHSYIQDDWQIHSRLTLHLGLRYELNTVPVEVNGLIPDAFRFRGDHNNFAPRFGFAWRADREGRTVVRGGYGVYYNILELAFVGLTRFNPPLIQNLTAARPVFPDLLGQAQAGIPGGLVLPDPNARTPYASHYNFRIEQQIPGSRSSVSLGYIGTTGIRLPYTTMPNGGDAMPQAQRPDPSVGVVSLLRTDATSAYHALEAVYAWRRSDLSLRGSYTFAKSLDQLSDYTSTNTGIAPALLLLDETNRGLNQGPSDHDMRHVVNLFGSYELPWARKNRWLGGWQVQSIVRLTSALPFTVFSGTDNLNRANANRALNVPGSLVRTPSQRQALRLADGTTTAQLIPAAGTLGDIGRNTERGDRLAQVNVSVGKGFALTETWRAEFRAEAFNLLNSTNYQTPDGRLNSATFGRALTALDSRQMQLALKLTF
ncbi:MAG: TonB-dependent receptor [Bryobacterales bacterium]|nr:TonB-dependent receptor [Bryobacterales bacterium]